MVKTVLNRSTVIIDDFLISDSSNLKDALEKITKNKHGIIFINDSLNRVIGCATDGDIRTFLLKSTTDNFLNKSIVECMNKDFVFVLSQDYSHESILKSFDSRIKLVPILDNDHQLTDIATKETISLSQKKNEIYRSKSPVRISFSGGGTDISEFFTKHNSTILNATINLFSYATLKIRDDSIVKLNSIDLSIDETFDSIHELRSSDSKLDLIRSVIDVLNPPFGFELTTRSDVPVGSGLGGSAVMLSAIIGAFDLAFGRKFDRYEIAQMAYQSERINQNIAGGWQDQYATVFGGFNYLELNKKENIVYPLRISSETINELEECLLLAYTGIKHNSNDIHTDQKESINDSDKELLAKEMLTITELMKQKLLKNKLFEFGSLLHQSWELKKQFSPNVSLPVIDKIYSDALAGGASGGKLLGAGRGGYLLFFVHPDKRDNVTQILAKYSLKIERFQFENNGLKSWKVSYEN